MRPQIEELNDCELDDASGGMIFVKIPALADNSVSTGSELAVQPTRSATMNGKGNTAMTEEIEMVIERPEKG